jgi:DNA-binding transcriptional LysR family regulator
MGERGPPVISSNSIAAMKAMIVRSQLIGFMTHIDARPETDRGELQCVPVVDSRIPPDRLTIAVRRNRSSIPAVDSFIQDLLLNFESVGA